MVYRPEEIAPLEARRIDSQCTSSKLLLRMLELKDQGKSYPKIGEELGVTKKVVLIPHEPSSPR